MFNWFKDEQAEGRCVSNYFLQSRAHDIANQFKVNNFQASNGWLHHWKERYSGRKQPLLLIGKSSPCGSSGFPLSLSEWSFTICVMPYSHK